MLASRTAEETSVQWCRTMEAMASHDPPIETQGKPGEPPGRLLIGLRYVLPSLVVLAGLIAMAFGSEVDLEGGASVVSAGLAIFAISWLYRASVDGDRERDAEEQARVYFDEHGRWPDSPRPR